jgi:transposase
MKRIQIPDASTVIATLQNEIQRSADARYDHRLHGLLLVAQGLNCCEVASLLGDSPRTVAYWVERYEVRGLAGLQEGERSGRPPKLESDQVADVQQALRGKPCDAGLEGNLWDGKTLAAYVRAHHRVDLGPRHCRRLLRQWEFRYRKPRPLIARADPERQAAHKKTSGLGRRSRRGSLGPG